MSGEELYEKLSKRDYTGSDPDKYAQFLKTVYWQLTLSNQQSEFFNLLEKAESEGKKIDLHDHNSEEITLSSLVLV